MKPFWFLMFYIRYFFSLVALNLLARSVLKFNNTWSENESVFNNYDGYFSTLVWQLKFGGFFLNWLISCFLFYHVSLFRNCLLSNVSSFGQFLIYFSFLCFISLSFNSPSLEMLSTLFCNLSFEFFVYAVTLLISNICIFVLWMLLFGGCWYFFPFIVDLFKSKLMVPAF